MSDTTINNIIFKKKSNTPFMKVFIQLKDSDKKFFVNNIIKSTPHNDGYFEFSLCGEADVPKDKVPTGCKKVYDTFVNTKEKWIEDVKKGDNKIVSHPHVEEYNYILDVCTTNENFTKLLTMLGIGLSFKEKVGTNPIMKVLHENQTVSPKSDDQLKEAIFECYKFEVQKLEPFIQKINNEDQLFMQILITTEFIKCTVPVRQMFRVVSVTKGATNILRSMVSVAENFASRIVDAELSNVVFKTLSGQYD